MSKPSLYNGWDHGLSFFTSRMEQSDLDFFSAWCDQTAEVIASTPDEATFTSCLYSISVPGKPTFVPLASLAFLVSCYPARVPVLKIISRFNDFWIALPESIKAGHDGATATILEESLRQITVDLDIPSLFSNSEAPALVDPTTKRTISHQKLSSFIKHFSLPLHPRESRTKPVISLALPNGYLLGLACVAVASYYTAAPINIAGGAAQFRNDVNLAGPQCILVLHSDVEKLGLDQPWVLEAKIQVLIVALEPQMTFSVQPLIGARSNSRTPNSRPQPNLSKDFALILFTSGTSGAKKVVPTTVFGLLLGVTCVIDSWGLTPQDSCINMMPLNHVGGLIRNLFAPLLSGGSSILCPAFDPNLFWDITQSQGTWYYASPSMHMSILSETNHLLGDVSKTKLRLVCNAAGALLPALASRLRDVFGCTVLPSYGMTECMPISTPPLSYSLDRFGTSGIRCGPEISILDDAGNPLPHEEIGRIHVRGGPTFHGYLMKGSVTLDKSVFTESNWFDTGDLGKFDQDGYLFLTGRGKEVINRGGEIISPSEVEEAITIASQKSNSSTRHIKQVMAFSAPQETLQEVVGVALVCSPGCPRPDIRALHAALKSSLHSSKWPMVVVYTDALPTSNNKLIRIKFAERMKMSPILDDTPLRERHFFAECPPINSPPTTKIPNSVCEVDLESVERIARSYVASELDIYVGTNHRDGSIVVYLAPPSVKRELNSQKGQEAVETLQERFPKSLDGFLVPSTIRYLEEPLPRGSNGEVNAEAVHAMAKTQINLAPASSDTEDNIRQAFQEVLNVSAEDLGPESDFFELGGGSMSAGRLLSVLRRDLGVRIPIDQIFSCSTVSSICTLVDQFLETSPKITQDTETQTGCKETYSSTNPLVLFINLLPIMLLYPMKTAFLWTVFIYALSNISKHWKAHTIPASFVVVITSLAIARAVTEIAAPILGIILKWVIIWKYKRGLYPMWGPYHTRWWLVERILQIFGDGIFRHFFWSRLLYYRLLGASIGRGVVIEKGTTIGEYDLVDIGDNARLDRCVCRPFAVEQNTSMFLGQITIGKNSNIGLRVQVAAGSILPDNTIIGPNSSSHEMDNKQQFDRAPFPRSHILTELFLILPMKAILFVVSSLPGMAGFVGIVSKGGLKSAGGVKAAVHWWASGRRIGFHYLARALNVSIQPFLWFACIIVIKKALDSFCGPVKAKPKGAMTWRDNIRKQILEEFIPHGNIGGLTKLFGRHYDSTSVAVRLLGGKVGKRVYWPGDGPTIEDFDLVDIGDDVVFGSNSHIITTDGEGSWPVKIESGAHIADRVVLSSGATIGERALIGSGALITRSQVCEPDSIWFGNRNGSAVCLANPYIPQPNSQSDEDESSMSEKEGSKLGRHESNDRSTTPFGRAFYQGVAPYHVFGQKVCFAYCTFFTIVSALYWNVTTFSNVILARFINNPGRQYDDPIVIYFVTVALLSALYAILSLLAIFIVIAAKWAILGRRRPGSYNWDESSYCQRWQVLLACQTLLRNGSGSPGGVLGMLTGTHYLVLYFRALGARLGKDCALFAGGRPGLMFTEPDLITCGDRVAIDDAGMVGHLNSRGKFTLDELHVGSRSALRSGSRVLRGAVVGEDAVLLEHTLILEGDTAEDGTVYQGWPADIYRGDRFHIVSRTS